MLNWGYRVINGVGAKWQTDNNPIRTTASRHRYKLVHGCGDILRIGSVVTLKEIAKRLEDLPRNVSDLPVFLCKSCVCWLLRGGVHVRGMCTWLDKHDVHAQLGKLVAIAVGHRLPHTSRRHKARRMARLLGQGLT